MRRQSRAGRRVCREARGAQRARKENKRKDKPARGRRQAALGATSPRLRYSRSRCRARSPWAMESEWTFSLARAPALPAARTRTRTPPPGRVGPRFCWEASGAESHHEGRGAGGRRRSVSPRLRGRVRSPRGSGAASRPPPAAGSSYAQPGRAGGSAAVPHRAVTAGEGDGGGAAGEAERLGPSRRPLGG